MLILHLGFDRVFGGEARSHVPAKIAFDYWWRAGVITSHRYAHADARLTHRSKEHETLPAIQSGNNRQNPEGTKLHLVSPAYPTRHTIHRPSIPNQPITNDRTHTLDSATVHHTLARTCTYTLGSLSRYETPCSLQVPISQKRITCNSRSSSTAPIACPATFCHSTCLLEVANNVGISIENDCARWQLVSIGDGRKVSAELLALGESLYITARSAYPISITVKKPFFFPSFPGGWRRPG